MGRGGVCGRKSNLESSCARVVLCAVTKFGLAASDHLYDIGLIADELTVGTSQCSDPLCPLATYCA
jgi:hypothetical protein